MTSSASGAQVSPVIGAYRERANIQKLEFSGDSTWHHADFSVRYVQTLRVGNDPANPYWEKLAALEPLPKQAHSQKKITIINTQHEKILFPDNAAIEAKALAYRTKYGINLLVTHGKLAKLVNQLQKKITEPTYVGVIDTGSSTLCIHTPAILFYFDGKSQNAECLIVDVMGKLARIGLEQLPILKCSMPDPNKIYFASKIRQVDVGSCRTGAFLLLRNALLHLKHIKQTGGFSQIVSINRESWADQLARGEKNVQNPGDIAELPPEWDYQEQIPNKSKDAGNFLAIRDLFSKKKEKREKPRTVAQFRAEHTKFQWFKGEINYFNADPAKVRALQAMSPPASTDIGHIKVVPLSEPGLYSLQIQVSRKINTYMLEKADSLWGKLPKAAEPVAAAAASASEK